MTTQENKQRSNGFLGFDNHIGNGSIHIFTKNKNERKKERKKIVKIKLLNHNKNSQSRLSYYQKSKQMKCSIKGDEFP